MHERTRLGITSIGSCWVSAAPMQNTYSEATSDRRTCGLLVRAMFGLSLTVSMVLGPAIGRSVYAQTVSATLVGAVTDLTGAMVANAKVTIVDVATNTPRVAMTNSSGNYNVPDLQPGTYSISVEAKGFQRELRPSIDVIVDTTTRIDFALQSGSLTETITVTDTPSLLQTDRADISTKLEAEKLENLPVGVNRNFQGLLNLVPGTTPATFQHSQFFNAQSSLQTEVNGSPRMGNSYQIEGIDDDERTGLLQILIPPADSIATVDISTNNFEAELGRAVGAVTNVTLKSGSNKLHGSASEYLQNTVFNARSYFNTSAKPHVAYNYYGGNVSGPIFKDKLFFYGDYFRTADHEATANTLSIPFTKYYVCNSSNNVDLSNGLIVAGTKVSGQIFDPATGNALGQNRAPFVNNQIPCARVNSVSLALLNLIPTPNQNTGALSNPVNNFYAAPPFRKSSNTFDGKVDYQLSEIDHLSWRYSQQISDVYQAPTFSALAGGPGNSTGFSANGHQNAYSTGLNYERAFSSKLLTEVRVGVAHYRSTANPFDYGSNDATTVGASGVNISQFSSGQVGVNLGSFSQPTLGYASGLPWIRGEANIDFVNNWTKILGNHTFKFGADIRRVRDDLLQDLTFGSRGLITFGENQTFSANPAATMGTSFTYATNFANDMASMLLDVPSTVGRDLNTFFPAFRQSWYFAFAGDKWQATPKLTLDYGVRWEFYQPPTPKSPGGFSNYDPVNNNLVLAGVGSNPMNLGLQARYKYLSPRTGFSYRFTGNTVVRGGFGISYTPFEDNTWAYNYPVRANNSYSPCGTGTAATYGTTVYTCVNNVAGAPVTWQSGFPAPVAVAIPSNGIIPVTGNASLTNQSYFYIPLSYHNPYVESWNLAVQQSLPANFSLTLSYVANHGVHIGSAQNINLGDRLNCGTACYPGQVLGFGRTAATSEYFLGTSSNYQSLQTQLSRRFTNGFSSNSAFTWGKGLGYQNSDDGGFQFWLQPRRNYAPNDYDRRLDFAESLTYELPWGAGNRWLRSGIAGKVIGGWKVSAILTLVTGAPFIVTANANTINTSGQTQTANLVGSYKVTHGVGSSTTWFDPTAFAQPAGCTGYAAATPTTVTCPFVPGVTVGNLGRNTFHGPGTIQDNVSLFKTFTFFERTSLDVRADVFQLSNSPQFANPNTSITATNFGQVTSTVGSGSGVNGIGGGRSMQVAAIIHF